MKSVEETICVRFARQEIEETVDEMKNWMNHWAVMVLVPWVMMNVLLMLLDRPSMDLD